MIPQTIADGRYRQPCACASRTRLARKSAKRLREQAEHARRDALSAETEGELVDAADFRAQAAEYDAKAREVVNASRRKHSPCITCVKGEVIGNGTYGGPGKKSRAVVLVI